jgi:hypothetical protein
MTNTLSQLHEKPYVVPQIKCVLTYILTYLFTYLLTAYSTVILKS